MGVEDSDFHYRISKVGKMGNTKEFIYHDEGKTVFWNRVKKKYYYSKAFRMYFKRRPTIAVSQFSPFKTSYVKHLDLLAKKPHIAIGIAALRSAEVGAGLLGLVLKK